MQIREMLKGSTVPWWSNAGWLPRDVRTLLIKPGSLWENVYVEQCDGRFENELLNREIPGNLTGTKVAVEQYSLSYCNCSDACYARADGILDQFGDAFDIKFLHYPPAAGVDCFNAHLDDPGDFL